MPMTRDDVASWPGVGCRRRDDNWGEMVDVDWGEEERDRTPLICNRCGKALKYTLQERNCSVCGSYIYRDTPIAEEGHPFPHNHEPLRTCHQDSA